MTTNWVFVLSVLKLKVFFMNWAFAGLIKWTIWGIFLFWGVVCLRKLCYTEVVFRPSSFHPMNWGVRGVGGHDMGMKFCGSLLGC